MLNKIIGFSVKNKLIVGLFTLVLVVIGAIEVSRLPIDALPDITSNQVQVITTSPSLAAPEVERLITFPIEQSMANIPGITEMRSISRFGLSVITIVFDDQTDFYWARQQVSERLIGVREQIPVTAGRPDLAPATTGLGEIYQYVIRPKKGYESKYDLTELRSIQDWVVRRQLLGTPGVADVSSFGGYLKEYEVAVIPDRLKSMNITVSDVFEALEKNNQNSGGAYIEKGPTALFIRTEGLAKNLEEIGQIVVRYNDNGIPVLIRDVADVRIGHAVRYGAMTYSDKGEVAGAVVLMLKGANASEVVQAVKEKVIKIKQTLPEGVVLETFYDRTKMVDRAIKTVKTNLLEGALIVVFVLVLFLGNLRAGLIVASVIPLSMLFAIIMMNIFGVSGNLMSLGALDFGLIVDGAVIIVEAVMHRLSHNRHLRRTILITQPEMDQEVKLAAGKMMNSAVFGQIIILIVYLPILTLVGIEGKMFKPMAQTVSFALIGAFILSLTYVPMITSLMLSKKIKHKENFSDRLMKRLHRLYKPVLQKALQFPKMVIAMVLILFIGSILLLRSLGGEFIPELEEGDFAVDARILTGSSLTESIKSSTKAATILERFPEVDKIVTRIGASEIPTDPMPVEMTDIIINLKPKDEWTSASSFDELANKMGEALSDIPGLTFGFQFPVQMRFNELISGARQDIVCKIFGEDLDSLAVYANKLGSLVNSVDGATDIYIETVTGLPQIEINYNRNALANYQLNIADVNQLVRTAFAGESAGQVYENERRFDLVVRLNESVRGNITDVQELLIPTRNGLQIPLQQVATVKIKEGWNQVQREDAKRRIIVGFNVRGRDVETVVTELEEKTNSRLKLPAGYYVNFGGQFQNLVEAKQRLAIAVPAALFLILVLLYFAFGSVKYGVMIFSAIPLSAMGGIVALWLRGLPFSISAGIGFIALFGVAVLNGIVLIAEFNRLKKEGMQDLNQIIIEGTRIRLRPVLMTAAVASLGFLPMALSHGAGAEVQRPLATVVIGGLITATFLTLIVLPIIYRWFEKTKKIKNQNHLPFIIFPLLCLPAFSHAQQVPVKHLTIQEVLQQASEQNLNLQSLQKQKEYWKALQEGVFDPGKTSAGIVYGNINNASKDNSFNVGQSFDLPVVYKRQRELYGTNEKLQDQLVKWKKTELDKEVKIVFYKLVDIQEREKLLFQLDSLYSRFQFSADLRFKSGESNLLEKTTADLQLQQLKLQQQQLVSEKLILQKQLQWLMNDTSLVLPKYNAVKMESLIVDSIFLQQHPLMEYYEWQKQLAAAQTLVERSKLSPSFSVEYINQSFIGYHSPDGINQVYYGNSRRFHSVGLTMGIPLFNKATNARIKAGKVNEEVARLNAINVSKELSMNGQQWMEELKRQQASIDLYESSSLEQADLIIKNASLGFQEGEIGYLEWTVLMNNAINIRIGYLEAVKNYNLTIIEIEYLRG